MNFGRCRYRARGSWDYGWNGCIIRELAQTRYLGLSAGALGGFGDEVQRAVCPAAPYRYDLERLEA